VDINNYRQAGRSLEQFLYPVVGTKTSAGGMPLEFKVKPQGKGTETHHRWVTVCGHPMVTLKSDGNRGGKPSRLGVLALKVVCIVPAKRDIL
jgi:hypothetical protein